MSDENVTAGELRALGREYVRIMKPGEVLIVRVPSDWTPTQVKQLNGALRGAGDQLGIGVLVVPGDDAYIAQPPRDPFS